MYNKNGVDSSPYKNNIVLIIVERIFVSYKNRENIRERK